jgi:hypothetical protein
MTTKHGSNKHYPSNKDYESSADNDSAILFLSRNFQAAKRSEFSRDILLSLEKEREKSSVYIRGHDKINVRPRFPSSPSIGQRGKRKEKKTQKC